VRAHAPHGDPISSLPASVKPWTRSLRLLRSGSL
jgi:hypothetical protein